MQTYLITILNTFFRIFSYFLNIVLFPIKMRSKIVIHDVEMEVSQSPEENSYGSCAIGSFSDDEDDISTEQSDGSKVIV